MAAIIQSKRRESSRRCASEGAGLRGDTLPPAGTFRGRTVSGTIETRIFMKCRSARLETGALPAKAMVDAQRVGQLEAPCRVGRLQGGFALRANSRAAQLNTTR